MAAWRTNLKRFREARKMSKMDIVRKAEMAYQTVSAWEDEPLASVDATKLKVLCDLFDCSYDEMVYLEDSEGEKVV